MIREVKIDDNNPYRKKIEYYEEEEVMGFLEYSIIYDRMEIDNILVYKQFRNKKIGTKLMEYIIKIAKENNLINITLEVRQSNYIAIKLYKKMGFKETAIRKYYYGDEDAILMENKVM